MFTSVPRPSGTWAMPSAAIFSVASPSMRWPEKRISPRVRTRPLSARKVVVLPAPFAPRIVVMPPSVTSNAMPFSTRVAP